MVCYLVGIKSNYITNWSGELNQLYVLFWPVSIANKTLQ